jgi:hypothetical protein
MEGDHWEELDIGGRIILRLSFEKYRMGCYEVDCSISE